MSYLKRLAKPATSLEWLFTIPFRVFVFTVLVQWAAACSDSTPAIQPDVVDVSSCSEALIDVQLTEPTTLINSPSDCDYYVEGTLTITTAVNIEPGTSLVMARDSQIFMTHSLDPMGVPDEGSITSALTAVGTPAQRITFRGEIDEQGFWRGIYLSNLLPSRIEHVDIRDGGRKLLSPESEKGLDINFSTVSLIDVSVSNSGATGLRLGDLVTLNEFKNNRFFGNGLSGIELPAGLVSSLDKESDYLGIDSANQRPYIHVSGFLGVAPSVARWKKLNAGYGIRSQINIESDEEIIIEAGVRIFGPRGFSVWDQGILRLEGTSELPILAAPNGDPRVSPLINPLNDPFGEIVSYWSGFDLNAGSELYMNHATVDFATRAIFIEEDARVEINNSTIRNSQFSGIQCYTAPGTVAESPMILIDDNTLIVDNLVSDISPDCLL